MSSRTDRDTIVLYQPRDEGAWMPLGLLALGSRLETKHVVLVDGRFDLAPEARVAELARNASCLGVTARTGRPLRDAFRVSAAARSANPRLTVVWGGPHATYAPASCLATGVVDACVRGSGEETFATVVGAVRGGSGLEGISGLVTDGTSPGPLGSPGGTDGIAAVRYSLVDLERHFQTRGARRLDYCSSRGTREGSFRGLPVDRVAAEIGELAERHRVSEVVFRDEDFFADSQRADAVVGALANGAVARVAWCVAARPEDLSSLDGRLARLEESRCRKLHVAVAPAVALSAERRAYLLEGAARLNASRLAARFELQIAEPGPEQCQLAAVVSLARELAALGPRFETPLLRLASVPPLVAAPDRENGVEAWVARAEASWTDPRAERQLTRVAFYFAEGQRPPGRGPGKRLLRMLSLLRVRLGFFGFDLERKAVEVCAVLRTGRHRATPSAE